MNKKAKCPGWRSNWVYGNGEPDPDPAPPDYTCAGCKHLKTEDGKDSCGLKKELEEKVVRLQKEIDATKKQIEGLKWEETMWRKTQRELKLRRSTESSEGQGFMDKLFRDIGKTRDKLNEHLAASKARNKKNQSKID